MSAIISQVSVFALFMGIFDCGHDFVIFQIMSAILACQLNGIFNRSSTVVQNVDFSTFSKFKKLKGTFSRFKYGLKYPSDHHFLPTYKMKKINGHFEETLIFRRFSAFCGFFHFFVFFVVLVSVYS